MKILYNIAGLYRPAGMERVLANKANWLAKHGYDIVIATTDQRNQPICFPFDEKISITDLGINYEDNNGGSFVNKLIHYPFKQIKHRCRLKQLIISEKPDVIISMFCNDASFIPRISGGAKTILEIHFSRFKRLQYGRSGIWALADRWRCKNDLKIVSRFDHFVVLTEEDRTYWGELHNIVVIPNARTFKFEKPNELDCKTVIAVGRYCHQKAFERLIEAWSLVAKENPEWVLRIVGDGEDRDYLSKRIADYGLQERIILGRSEIDMESIYKNASILALSSRYEGLPMVLLEAQAAGLPVVCFACKCGPKDVITNGIDGILVEEGDIPGLADGLFALMKDDALRKRMGSAAFKSSDRFDEENIMRKWIILFEKQL